jgi:hypothetical protein
MKKKQLYKFLRTGLKSGSGNHTWKVGEWYKEQDIEICNRGFHASNTPREAFEYVQGEVLALVEGNGKSIEQDDKSCWEEMRVVKAYHWTKADSVAYSIFASELVLANFEKAFPNDKRPREAIEAAKKWLGEPTSANESAWSAAVRSAAAAWSAAESAKKKIYAAIDAWFEERIQVLTEI